tara:strand:+ start:297 stop:434 length:138 start_codon:yes stop_codon:yes gene_type:complete
VTQLKQFEIMISINKLTAAKIIALWNIPTLLLLGSACEIAVSLFS